LNKKRSETSIFEQLTEPFTNYQRGTTIINYISRHKSFGNQET